MLSLARTIDNINGAIGRGAAWLTLALVLVQFAVVIMRYVFQTGSIQMQEAIIYMHGILFMMAAADTFIHDAHVRIDILFSQFSARQKQIVDIFGCLILLLPFCILLWVVAFDYIALAWLVREGSREASGLPYIYLLKSVILVFATQMGLQAIAHALRVGLHRE